MSNRPTEFLDPVPEHPHIRAPFSWSPVLIIVIGILLFLLFLSAGFNIWVLSNPEHPMRQVERARVQEDLLRQQQVMTQQAEERIRQMQQDFQQKLGALQRKNDDLTAQLEAAKQPMDEAKCDNCAEPQEQKWGTLEGRFVFKGELPKIESYEKMIRMHPDADHLLNKSPKEMLLDPEWRIDEKTKGVANVCVFIMRPANGILQIHDDDKSRNDKIVVEAVYGAYQPYITTHYPVWFDGTHSGKTGQRFAIKSTTTGGDRHPISGQINVEPGLASDLPKKGEERERNLRPEPKPLSISSTQYSWMRGRVWVFDHPYFALTKSDGSFTIPRVPAGIDVQVMAWHESKGWLFTKDGKTVTLKAGKNTLDEFDLSAKR